MAPPSPPSATLELQACGQALALHLAQAVPDPAPAHLRNDPLRMKATGLMDFVHDQMHDGRKFRILTVIDQWSRESVSLEANYRLTGRCVGLALDQAARQRGWPRAITVDNGTEFTSKALDDWAYKRGVKLDYTRPGKPTDNGLIESFNGRLRDEFLNVNEFITMHDVREKLKAWQDDYNHCRPHGALGHLTPSEFATMRSGQPKEVATL